MTVGCLHLNLKQRQYSLWKQLIQCFFCMDRLVTAWLSAKYTSIFFGVLRYRFL